VHGLLPRDVEGEDRDGARSSGGACTCARALIVALRSRGKEERCEGSSRARRGEEEGVPGYRWVATSTRPAATRGPSICTRQHSAVMVVLKEIERETEASHITHHTRNESASGYLHITFSGGRSRLAQEVSEKTC